MVGVLGPSVSEEIVELILSWTIFVGSGHKLLKA